MGSGAEFKLTRNKWTNVYFIPTETFTLNLVLQDWETRYCTMPPQNELYMNDQLYTLCFFDQFSAFSHEFDKSYGSRMALLDANIN